MSSFTTVILAMTLTQSPAATQATPYTWKNVAIQGGGFVSGIVTHPRARGVIYARTDIGGAYRWDDSNRSWIPITDWISGPDWNYTGIESLAVDPKDPNVVYIAAGTYTNNWTQQNGAIFRSADQAKTWTKSELPFKNGGNEEGRNAGERLAVDPNDGRIIYFGSRNNGLWRSTDASATWSQVQSFPITGRTNGIGSVFVVFDGSTIYAGASSKDDSIYRSTDSGATWGAVPDQPRGMLPNHAAAAKDGSLFITYANAPGPNGMTDGAVWKFDPKESFWADVSPVKPSADDKFGYCGVSIDAQRPGTLVVSTMDRWTRKDTIFRSTDAGKTWTSLLAPDKATFDHSSAPYTKRLTPHWTGDVEINPFDSDHVMFVTGYGIWASRNVTKSETGQGTHWTFDNDGLEECVINQVISPPGDQSAPVLSVMWDLGGFRHEKLDESPRDGKFQPPNGRNTSIDFAELKPDVIARVFGAGGNSTGGAFSTDNGCTWMMFPARPGGKGDGIIALSTDGEALVWSPEQGPVVSSHDRGATWSAASGIPSKASVISDRASPKRFYGFDESTGVLYVSNDTGLTFTQATSELPKGEGQLRAAPAKEGHLWLASHAGVYRSTDAGATFVKLDGLDSASRIGFGKSAPGHAYPAIYVVGSAGGVYGFYRSDDEGKTWVRINDDRSQFARITSITGDPRAYGRVYIGSASRGVLYGEPVGAGRK